jgi:hypothetical protein
VRSGVAGLGSASLWSWLVSGGGDKVVWRTRSFRLEHGSGRQESCPTVAQIDYHMVRVEGTALG